MSDRRAILDQCPSSKKEGKPVEKPTEARHVSQATGKAYWRSLDELAGTSDFKEFLHREFPSYASELLDGSRRHFLRIMGASLALAGAATLPGCRRPDHKILAYNTSPEDVVPGKALYYATAMPLPGGSCEGLLAETHEGRPTKLEGNPLHPANYGKSSTLAQASVLDLYDPDRDPGVIEAMATEAGRTFQVTPWADFTRFAMTHFAAFDAKQGQGLAFLVEKTTSPSRDALKSRILDARKWPKAKWYSYEAIDNEGELEGTRMAFGQPMKELVDLSKAKVILCLDRDFMGGEGSTVNEARGFAAGRYQHGTRAGHAASDSAMSRLYVIESMFSLTGGQADHRWTVKPSRVAAAALVIAQALLSKLGGSAPAGLLNAITTASASLAGEDLPSATAIDALTKDLADHRGECIVMTGPSQPAEVHALVAALNSALGNIGKTVQYAAIKGDAGADSLDNIKALCSDIDAGSIETLVTIGCNPVYSAPADLAFAEKYAKVAHRIHLGEADETAQASTMHLSRTHYLESWSDVETWDGVYSVVQPMIQPLFGGRNELELLSFIAGEGDTDPYTIVRSLVRSRVGTANFESKWRRTLHDGLAAPASEARAAPALSGTALGSAFATLASRSGKTDQVEVLYVASPHVHDGRFANNGWLQELPDAVTKIAWDNPALASPATLKKLGFSTDRHLLTPEYCHGSMATIEVGGRSTEMALWPQPGLADDTIVIRLGYGRRIGGRVAAATGFNGYQLRASDSMRIARGAAITASSLPAYLLATTQDHWTMEGRDILREVDHERWRKYGDLDYSTDAALQIDPYDRSRNINFAGLLGMESHTPANVDIYKRSQKNEQGLRFTELDADGNPLKDADGNIVPIKNKHGRELQQWGMSIDLTTCTGCSACVIACQAENNIPIVGKKEVAKGRELHWIRVDRYYGTTPPTEADKNTYGIGGDAHILSDPDMVVMPVTCVHCENAPCEVVCPVNATVHDEHGNNNMAYNRCIGTRYCSNNCPYKVRRFNFFDYGTKQFRGDFSGKDTVKNLPGIMQPPSENFVPPRLRQKKLEVATMQYNPHVTVRSRGVMEKCTYCIQRVNFARIETKLSDLNRIPDGFMQTACQQACPTDAIIFGDIYDHGANGGKGSRVKQARNDGRSYQLLSFLNTRPRTTHMVRLRNPNPSLVDASRRARWDEPLGHHGHGDHGDHGHGDDHSHTDKKPDGHVMSLPVFGNGARA